MINIEYANKSEIQYIIDNDKHVSTELVEMKIKSKEILLVKDEEHKILGWLRFNYFWDNTPFMNLLYIDEAYRNKGVGTSLVYFWEIEMKARGYELVMTSTLSNELAQHFYRKLGYKDAGSLLLENEPLEIIFTKNI
ncbi:GNAT family N-acetyltransferase [Clostridium folliculivorans]|uniref:N-acetyltransferase n=1 Tax=Clostridium folliculivorans TaxID=2886038 RepID=A0A9W6DDN8_9CLOT|nr:GNAT family N-acetyltransferase [Clostridium folliculivorans]GKU27871.1 N-acetyltransferase [Clostridium folliculivorans]GKU32630.1 N-acetyltransferase [Clostridium folliculivorans]